MRAVDEDERRAYEESPLFKPMISYYGYSKNTTEREEPAPADTPLDRVREFLLKHADPYRIFTLLLGFLVGLLLASLLTVYMFYTAGLIPYGISVVSAALIVSGWVFFIALVVWQWERCEKALEAETFEANTRIRLYRVAPLIVGIVARNMVFAFNPKTTAMKWINMADIVMSMANSGIFIAFVLVMLLTAIANYRSLYCIMNVLALNLIMLTYIDIIYMGAVRPLSLYFANGCVGSKGIIGDFLYSVAQYLFPS